MTNTPAYKQICSGTNISCSSDPTVICANKLVGDSCNNCNRTYTVCQGDPVKNKRPGVFCSGDPIWHGAPCKADGTFKWPDANQIPCCTGEMNDPEKCDPCWCPFSGPCLPHMLEYCKSTKDGHPLVTTDDRCKQWCKEFPDLCKQIPVPSPGPLPGPPGPSSSPVPGPAPFNSTNFWTEYKTPIIIGGIMVFILLFLWISKSK